MTYTVARTNVKSLRPGDPHFTISNGLAKTAKAELVVEKPKRKSKK